jgi:oxygen-independent coproporphyrinogen-3 oxidase
MTAADLPISAGPGRSPVRGLYVHVPFCFHKCHYCDFYSIVDQRDRQGKFADRLVAELEASVPWLQDQIESIFVGGGTPTLLDQALWSRLLGHLRRHAFLAAGGEFTVEANPETVTADLAGLLADGGVNRVSIGAQSFSPRHLKTLERWHEPDSVRRSVDCFRSAGVENLNLDLIFAIPGQTLEEWRADLDAALALEPSHLSCYSLMYESNTPLTARLKAGAITRVDADLEADMYEATIDTLEAAGLEQYEISNWCRPGQRCRHNMLYWTNASWWPIGPSASGHVSGVRWKNVPRLTDYLEVDSNGLPHVTDVERLGLDGRIGEELMLGLRLIDGLPMRRIVELLATGERGRERSAAIDAHLNRGLLAEQGGRLRLTRPGLLLADSVLADLI